MPARQPHLAAVSVPDIYRDCWITLDADTFLRDINFPEAARHLAFEVFSRSFFSEPGELSAAELASDVPHLLPRLQRRSGLRRRRLDFDAALWNPLGGYLESLGGDAYTPAYLRRGCGPGHDLAFAVRQ